MPSSHGKIFAICCEDLADALALGGTDQSRVRHVHRAIGVFAHQFAHAGNVRRVKGEKLEWASLYHFPQNILGGGHVCEEVHGFGHGGPDGGQRFSYRLQGRGAFRVVLVVGIDESYKRPSINEDQRRFRWRFKNSAKRRPVCEERLALPPRTVPIRSASISNGASIGSWRSAQASMA